MGLGKTAQAIATIVAAKAFPALIICPSSLKLNWQKEWQIVAGMRSMVLTDRVKSTWMQYHRVGMVQVFIVNYESLKKYFVESIDKDQDEPLRLNHIKFKESINIFKSVTIDELHRCKEGKTQQAKFVMGITKGKEWIQGLTGTPLVNKPKDLISQLHIINRLQDMGGYKYFMQRYCGGNGTGATNLKELHYKLATTCYFKRNKKEVLKELPDKMRKVILCDISTRKEYNAAMDDLANYLRDFRDKSDPEIQKSLRGEIMVRIGICKDISARGKLTEVQEYIDEILEAGEKVVLFIHQKKIAEALLHKYPKAVTVRGDDSIEQRQANVQAFQNNPRVQLIICNIKAGGVGITLTASSRVAFVELPWHPADCDQCEDRCHRIGQHDSVEATYFLGHNTIDEDIYKLIEEKRTMANTVTGTVDSISRETIDRITKTLFAGAKKDDGE
jgi:SWI/SNF-related matrix-associated actin-dependent regulator 1 of chromatin subfamily A